MTDGGCEYKEVKKGVVKGDALDLIKNSPDGVQSTTRCQPKQVGQREVLHKRFEGKHDDPTHGHIADGGGQLEATREEQFQDNARQRDAPYGHQYAPAPGTADGEQTKRGVGTGNAQVDGGVVKDFESTAQLRCFGVVVEGRGGKNGQYADAVNGISDPVPHAALFPGFVQQRHKGDEGQEYTDGVTPYIESFFGRGIGLRGGIHKAKLRKMRLYGTFFRSEDRLIKIQ